MVASRRTRLAVSAAALALAFGAGAATVALAGHGPDRGDPVIDQAVASIEAHAAHPVPRSKLEAAAVQGMLNALGDPWADYYPRGDYNRLQQVMAGSYSGVGLWLERQPAGGIKVLSVQPGSPAAQARLHSGDRIVAVAGRPVAGRSVTAVSDLLRGRPGSRVQVTTQSPSGWVHTVVLRRATVTERDVTTSMLTRSVERIRVAAFTAGVGAQVRALVAAAQRRGLSGIVLDLRNNPGGLLDEAVETASAFLRGGPVVTYVQRGQPPRTLDALGDGDVATPLVVLVNGGTASAAEIVAAALQDRGRAVLIGSQTFGKGTVQAPQRLANGGAVELTVGHYLTPSGRSLDGVGITPDVLIPARTPEQVVDSRALEVLSGLTAAAGATGRG